MANQLKIPNALTIAGSDSSGGAGIQADLKAFSALGAYGASVITALTAQNTQEVRSIQLSPPEFILDQMDVVLEDIDIHAIKTGMLGNAEVVTTVANRVRAEFKVGKDIALVVDPVMISKTGNALLLPEAVDALKNELLPLATVVTPNLPEAAALLEMSEPDSLEGMKDMAHALLKLGSKSVLLKGGHLGGRQSPDVFYDGSDFLELWSDRIDTKNTHGTGCSLAAAIAAGLAQGLVLKDAVKQAKEYIGAAISAADQLNVGSGHGPVHHFCTLWSSSSQQTK